MILACPYEQAPRACHRPEAGKNGFCHARFKDCGIRAEQQQQQQQQQLQLQLQLQLPAAATLLQVVVGGLVVVVVLVAGGAAPVVGVLAIVQKQS